MNCSLGVSNLCCKTCYGTWHNLAG